ncbi:MAG TPA: winged helix-turn-helix transcriptional regulator [Dehalococcoidia bacterium]|nr:winged helix-turn-helix transcriptional regulator [Dehalococcoidia bacterium]
MREWTLISHHGLVLASISKNPEKTAREISDDVGITERTAHKIIIDLEQAGYITRSKNGRHNVYRIHPHMPLRNTMSDAAVGELLELFGWQQKEIRGLSGSSARQSLIRVC